MNESKTKCEQVVQLMNKSWTRHKQSVNKLCLNKLWARHKQVVNKSASISKMSDFGWSPSPPLSANVRIWLTHKWTAPNPSPYSPFSFGSTSGKFWRHSNKNEKVISKSMFFRNVYQDSSDSIFFLFHKFFSENSLVLIGWNIHWRQHISQNCCRKLDWRSESIPSPQIHDKKQQDI